MDLGPLDFMRKPRKQNTHKNTERSKKEKKEKKKEREKRVNVDVGNLNVRNASSESGGTIYFIHHSPSLINP